jgi:Chaperone of endosialidase
MKTKIQSLLIMLSCLAGVHQTFAQATAFTYQGQLQNNGAPANGTYDLQFVLFTTNQFGSPATPVLTNAAVSVNNGLFTTTLDFGAGVFTGTNYWLDISVRTNGNGTFAELSPRQPVTPTPYAVFANNVNGLTIQPNTNGAPNVINGSSVNFVSSGVVGATISGGGATNVFGFTSINNPIYNHVAGDFGTVSGGFANTAYLEATVGGGFNNVAGGQYDTISGGVNNNANGTAATVSGGEANLADGNFATVSGGSFNEASGDFSFAAGQGAQATNNGAFVWADSQASPTGSFTSTANNQFLIRAAGGVGINTASPQQALSVVGGMRIDQGDQNSGNDSANALTFGSISGEGIASQRTAGTGKFDLVFYTAFLPRVTILATGNVGIGTANPDALLSVNGPADKPGGGSWSTFSDGRLKDIGANFTHGLEALDNIQPIHYHYKSDNPLNLPSGPDYIGVVAQQVQSAIPEAVHSNQNGYLVVNNDPIIWTMFNAIKELNQQRAAETKSKNAEIQSLKQQNDALAERLNELEATVKQLAAKK